VRRGDVNPTDCSTGTLIQPWLNKNLSKTRLHVHGICFRGRRFFVEPKAGC
jgi:hypothetical protein